MYENLILPSQSAPFGNLLQGEIARRDNQAQIDYQRQLQQQRYAEQQQQQQQQDQEKGLTYLDKATTPSTYLSGVAQIDKFAGQQVAAMYQNFVQKAGKVPLPQLAQEIREVMQPLIIGTTAAKEKYKEQQERIAAITATNKNVNKERLQARILERISKDVLAPDSNGGHSFKPADQIDLTVDYVNDELNGENAHEYANGDGGLIRHLQSGMGEKPMPYIVKNSDGGDSKFEVIANPLVDVSVGKPSKDGTYKTAPTVSLKKEEENSFTDDKGKPLTMLPKGAFDAMLPTDEMKIGFKAMYKKWKQDSGYDDMQLLPAIEDKLQRHFAYKIAEENALRPAVLTHRDKPPRISVNTGKAKEEPTIRDVYSGIANTVGNDVTPLNKLDATAQQIVLRFANDLTKEGEGQNYYALQKDGSGKINILYNTGTLKAPKWEVVAPISSEDINLKAQVSSKAKNKILQSAKTQSPEKKNNKTKPTAQDYDL